MSFFQTLGTVYDEDLFQQANELYHSWPYTEKSGRNLNEPGCRLCHRSWQELADASGKVILTHRCMRWNRVRRPFRLVSDTMCAWMLDDEKKYPRTYCTIARGTNCVPVILEEGAHCHYCDSIAGVCSAHAWMAQVPLAKGQTLVCAHCLHESRPSRAFSLVCGIVTFGPQTVTEWHLHEDEWRAQASSSKELPAQRAIASFRWPWTDGTSASGKPNADLLNELAQWGALADKGDPQSRISGDGTRYNYAQFATFYFYECKLLQWVTAGLRTFRAEFHVRGRSGACVAQVNDARGISAFDDVYSSEAAIWMNDGR